MPKPEFKVINGGDVRCLCNVLLCKLDETGAVEIKCRRCKRLHKIDPGIKQAAEVLMRVCRGDSVVVYRGREVVKEFPADSSGTK
jgi:phage FluMu protein Com